MASCDAIRIGLIGFGVVGGGVARALHDKAEAIAGHVGCPVVLQHILVRDPRKARGWVPPDVRLTTSPDGLLDDPDLHMIVELMGGEQPALSYLQRALTSGKHVVTANKEVMAKHGPSLLAQAAESRVALRFEASVGGGIPIIGPLLSDLAANNITAVNAIINGTTNYMLTRMANGAASYEEVLQEAQRLGYAEADPTADVDGIDAAYKLAILSSLAFRTVVRDVDVYREGISRLAPIDFKYAADLGYAIKLLAIGKVKEGVVQARVHPAFLPTDNPLAKVDGVFNAVELEGDLVGWAMFQGPGAGSHPTASAVMGDVLDIARAIAADRPALPAPTLDRGLAIQQIDELETKYYIRLQAYDRPGVMARIAWAFGELGVSLASVIQKEVGDAVAEIVVTTHTAREASVQEAVRRIAALNAVREVSNVVRVEDGVA
ncbi:MAG: homoserine dehydrogenase [Dehalococcoidia bacterium]